MVVVVEIVGRTFQAARPALNVDAHVPAGIAGTESVEAGEVDVDIVGDEQVIPAVGIVVAEGRTGCPQRVAAQAGAFCHIGEGAVAIVAIEHHAGEAGDQQVGPSIVVEVSDGRAHGPAGGADAGLVSHVGESAVVIVVEERTASLDAGARHLDGLRVGEINVGPAVAIVVDERHASAHRLDDELLLGAGVMIEMDSGGGCNVDELRIVNGRRFFLRGGGQRSRDTQAEHGYDEKSGSQPQKSAVRGWRCSIRILRAIHPAVRL